MSKAAVIIGGHGHIALRLARLLSPQHKVTSVIRDQAHSADIRDTGASPLVLSLENDSASRFTAAFKEAKADVVYFSAGAGGKGGAERTKAVDYEGAVKIFDAIEGMDDPRPHLILVSAIDSRDLNKIPEHYDENDLERSKKAHEALKEYYKWKLAADLDLSKRTSFPWTIVRPSTLTNDPGVGKAEVGRTHITNSIARDDVAELLARLIERRDAAGLALDMIGGDEPISSALDAAIKKKDANLYL